MTGAGRRTAGGDGRRLEGAGPGPAREVVRIAGRAKAETGLPSVVVRGTGGDREVVTRARSASR
ncbi:hypothetical protein GCM10010363_16790 [Streptomyces omiyaensis]|nr:hypothetical protein GCM10010363_16790 [Streptomyces omiyaensis]